jgi:RND family efflux transporter MFP subunit
MMKVRVVVVALFLLSACSTQQSADSFPTPTPRPAPQVLEKPTYTVERGEVIDKVEVSGFVSAKKQQELSFTQNGFAKVIYVERNQAINEGDVLIELDQGELPNQLRQAEVTLQQAQAEQTSTNADREAAVKRAQLDLADAQGALAKLQQPASAADIARAQAAIKSAQANLEAVKTNASAEKTAAELTMRKASEAIPPLQAAYVRALERWNDVKDHPDYVEYKPRQQDFLQAESDLKSAEYALDQAKLAYETAQKNEAPAIAKAEAQLAEAQADLAALRAGPKAADLAAARREVERAQLALQEAQRGGGNEDLEKRIATAQLELERIQAQIAAGRLVAPFTGKVAEVSVKPGDQVEAYQPVITVMDDSERELLVESVTSNDATRIGVGMPVEIVFSRHPGRTFNGVITALPTSATSSAATIDQDKAYHIEYTADVPLEVGDLGRVVVTLSKKDDALWLPPQAIRAFEGRRFVVVKDGDRQRRQDVRIGITSTERVEILDGLKEGDVVVGQ